MKVVFLFFCRELLKWWKLLTMSLITHEPIHFFSSSFLRVVFLHSQFVFVVSPVRYSILFSPWMSARRRAFQGADAGSPRRRAWPGVTWGQRDTRGARGGKRAGDRNVATGRRPAPHRRATSRLARGRKRGWHVGSIRGSGEGSELHIESAAFF